MENGIMKNLRMDLNNPALEEEKQIEQLGRVVDYFCKNRGRHSSKFFPNLNFPQTKNLHSPKKTLVI